MALAAIFSSDRTGQRGRRSIATGLGRDIDRAKGFVYVSEDPDSRYIFQRVGTRYTPTGAMRGNRPTVNDDKRIDKTLRLEFDQETYLYNKGVYQNAPTTTSILPLL